MIPSLESYFSHDAPPKLANYDEARAFLAAYTFFGQSLQRGNPTLKRIQALLKRLDNPQAKLKAFHIAGTSGKGSTAVALSKLLQSQGYSVGLEVSPHLLDLRERFQINNQLISEEKFVELLNDVIPALHRTYQMSEQLPMYYELCTALAFYLFAQENVDYVVIETHMGGRFDATNVLTRPDKIVILTRLGLDHMQFLGTTLDKIAHEKAGIIHPSNRVFCAALSDLARPVIEQAVQKNTAQLSFVEQPTSFKNIDVSLQGTKFDFQGEKHTLKDLELGLIGEHQVENVSLALSALEYAAVRDGWQLNEEKICTTLKSLSFLGRFDVRNIGGRTVILDGAHNPQKMASLIKTLQQLFSNQQFTFLLGFGPDAQSKDMLLQIVPHAQQILLPDFPIGDEYTRSHFQNPILVKHEIGKLNYSGTTIYNDIEHMWQHAQIEAQGPIVITGSLYFVGAMYANVLK